MNGRDYFETENKNIQEEWACKSPKDHVFITGEVTSPLTSVSLSCLI